MRLPSTENKAVLCAGLAQAFVAQVFGVPFKTLAAPSRKSPRAAFARQVAMYLTHTVFEVSLTRTGAAFGRDRTTATHACRVVEEALEDEALDSVVRELAALLRAAAPSALPPRSPRDRRVRIWGERHAAAPSA